jgi:DNA-binding LacI/PurR family transcriptional regulator
MGYVPDSAAQGLRSRTSKTLGIIISSVTNPIYARIVRAIEAHAHEAGYDLFIAQTHNNTELEEISIRRLVSRRVDGLLIAPVYRIEPEARVYQELLTRGTPTVLIGPSAPFCSAFPSVSSDDLRASYDAITYLLDLGHKRIAILTGRLVAPWAQERLEGYRRALREANLDVDDRLVFTAGSTIEDGVKCGLQILNENCNATAVQAVNDLVAIGCANAFLQQGVRIPQDMSLVGFGNIRVSEHFRVPLTTVRQPKFQLGVAAMETMLKVLRRDRVESRRLPAELLVRESTAPPRVVSPA